MIPIVDIVVTFEESDQEEEKVPARPHRLVTRSGASDTYIDSREEKRLPTIAEANVTS